MPPSVKGSLELGIGMLQIGVRLTKAKFRHMRRPAPKFGSVEASAITTAGTVELVRVAPERRKAGRGHIGPHYRYAVEVGKTGSGNVTALLDHGTASAVLVVALDEENSDVVAPAAVSALLTSLQTTDPWLRRASLALHPDDVSMSRALRLRGFVCEGEVPGYVEDQPGTRRHLWTMMFE